MGIKLEEKEERVVDLKLIKGGKEPPTFTGNNWLSDLPEGTMFFVNSKTDPLDFSLGLFQLVKKEGKVIILWSPEIREPDGRPKDIFVNSNRFCNRYMLYQQVCVLSPEEQKEQRENYDERNRIQFDRGSTETDVEGPKGS